jgi:hypothetical protein
VNRLRPNRFRDVPGDERIARASARAHRLVDHIATLFLMHESNTLVIYSPKMSAQIPRPFAAHAFNQCQRSMHLFEIIRLCALWDPPGTDRESILTIVELFNEPALVEQIARDARPLHQPKRNWPTPTRAAILRMLPHEKPGGRKIGLSSPKRRRSRCASSLRLPPTRRPRFRRRAG